MPKNMDMNQYEAMKARPSLWKRFRSAVTGRFLKKKDADANKRESIEETRR